MIVLSIIALFLRVILAYVTTGYTFDLNCFFTWSSEAINDFSALYDGHIFCDYPPLYMYVLFALGKVKNALSFFDEKVLFAFPAFAADLGLGYLTYKISGSKKLFVLCVFCPAIIINSAVWGQIDGIFALVAGVALLFLHREKYIFSSVFFALSILLKPQGFILLPICLFVFVKKAMEDKKYIKTLVLCIFAFLLTMVIVSFPFCNGKPFAFLYKIYSGTLGQYPYASLNAYNFYSMIGANFKDIAPYRFIGLLGILMSLSAGAYLFFKRKKDVFFVSATILLFAFAFVTRMHERYLLPAASLYLMSYAVFKNKKTLFLFLAVSFISFINVFLIYVGYSPLYLEMILGAATVLSATYSVIGDKNDLIQTKQSKITKII